MVLDVGGYGHGLATEGTEWTVIEGAEETSGAEGVLAGCGDGLVEEGEADFAGELCEELFVVGTGEEEREESVEGDVGAVVRGQIKLGRGRAGYSRWVLWMGERTESECGEVVGTDGVGAGESDWLG
jgi:hypothetical protein